MATAVQTYQQQLAVELIDASANVRELDADHVAGLAASIAVQGVLVPLVVRDAGDGRYQLVAGFHRFAAVRQLGAAVPRDGQSAVSCPPWFQMSPNASSSVS